MSLNHWITIEGPKRLKEAMARLKITRDLAEREDF